MPGRTRDGLESQLEDVNQLDVPDRPESLDRVTPDPPIQFGDFFVRQPGVCLCDRDETVAIPYPEGVVGEQAGALAASRLRVDQDGVDGERVDFPFPPVAPAASDAVDR